MQAQMQTMQQTHMQKVVAVRAEEQKLLSRRRQSDYRYIYIFTLKILSALTPDGFGT